jgi:peptidoglycan/xylan/chitin deacetylase (PgdA/CDA1 family)
METVSRPDEPEPSATTNRLTIYPFFPVLLLLLLIACDNEPEPTVKDKTLAKPDSSKIEKGQAVKLVKEVRLVEEGNAANEVKPGKQKKKIYLTFDDGPNRGTRTVLDIVQQENVPVTFFIVGEHVYASPAQQRVWDSLRASPNVEIANHSYTHAHNRYDRFYEAPGTVVKDMERTRDSLLPETNIVRAPGRNSWRIDSLHFTDIKKSKAAMDSLQKAGFIVMGWDLEWKYDHKTFGVKNTADEMMQQVDSLFKKGKTRLPGNLVLLAHDQVYNTPADSLELRSFIQKLKSRDDYEMVLVSAYPAINKKQATAKPDSMKLVSPSIHDSMRKPVGDSVPR